MDQLNENLITFGTIVGRCSTMSSSVYELENLLNEIRTRVVVDKDGVPKIPRDVDPLLDKVKDYVIDTTLGNLLEEAYEWVEKVRNVLEELRRFFNLYGVTLPKEFNSFVEDPRAHLRKKLFNYVYDLVRNKIALEDFVRKATAAVRTSLRTNMRSAYQIWCLTNIVLELGRRGYGVVYPEHRYLNLDRSGKQKLGIIPPNVVLLNVEKGFISFFHEAPRPLTWEDTKDLEKIWSLYTALRPDVLVYGGRVLNIVDLSLSPPIKRPDVLIEFKELEDWFTRVRDLRGYFRKPLTAEEWRSKWLEGLFDGLADILGVQRTEVRQRVESGASLRIKEYQLIQLYRSTYRPRYAILVSRKPVPSDVRKDLEANGIIVVDGVEFDSSKLQPVVDILESIARFEHGEAVPVFLDPETIELAKSLARRLGIEKLEDLVKYALEHLRDVVESRGGS